MESNSRRRSAYRIAASAFLFCLVTTGARTSNAEGQRIILRPSGAPEGEAIHEALRARHGATRVRTLPSGAEIWEVPADARAEVITRYWADARFMYIEALEGNENQLFADRSVTGDLTPQQSAMIAGISQRRTTGTLHTVALQSSRFTTDLLQSSTTDQQIIKLNLLPGQEFDARPLRVQTRPGGFTWYGGLPNDGSATLVVRGNDITGQVRVDDKLYSIKPIGGGLHAVYEVKPAEFPPEHSDQFDQTITQDKAPPAVSVSLPNPSADSAAPVIDVMVLYPAAVASAVVDLEGSIQLAIDVTNQTFENSKVQAKLQLVHHQAVEYAGTGETGPDLTALRASEQGLSAVPSLRDLHGADFVVMWVEEADFCGEAADIMASDLTAFAVVRSDCATDNLSFPHELGHLLGARHDLGKDPRLSPFEHGHGHLVGSEKEPEVTQDIMAWVLSWLGISAAPAEAVTDAVPVARTIMAYGDGCGNCERIPYWSTPELEYKGRVLGTEKHEDNVRVLNRMAPEAAAFRSKDGQ